jgi:biopolymer transport protein ExbB/TolQ
VDLSESVNNWVMTILCIMYSIALCYLFYLFYNEYLRSRKEQDEREAERAAALLLSTRVAQIKKKLKPDKKIKAAFLKAKRESVAVDSDKSEIINPKDLKRLTKRLKKVIEMHPSIVEDDTQEEMDAYIKECARKEVEERVKGQQLKGKKRK